MQNDLDLDVEIEEYTFVNTMRGCGNFPDEGRIIQITFKDYIITQVLSTTNNEYDIWEVVRAKDDMYQPLTNYKECVYIELYPAITIKTSNNI